MGARKLQRDKQEVKSFSGIRSSGLRESELCQGQRVPSPDTLSMVGDLSTEGSFHQLLQEQKYL